MTTASWMPPETRQREGRVSTRMCRASSAGSRGGSGRSSVAHHKLDARGCIIVHHCAKRHDGGDELQAGEGSGRWWADAADGMCGVQAALQLPRVGPAPDAGGWTADIRSVKAAAVLADAEARGQAALRCRCRRSVPVPPAPTRARHMCAPSLQCHSDVHHTPRGLAASGGRGAARMSAIRPLASRKRRMKAPDLIPSNPIVAMCCWRRAGALGCYRGSGRRCAEAWAAASVLEMTSSG